jgi:hypothetical protein
MLFGGPGAWECDGLKRIDMRLIWKFGRSVSSGNI